MILLLGCSYDAITDSKFSQENISSSQIESKVASDNTPKPTENGYYVFPIKIMEKQLEKVYFYELLLPPKWLLEVHPKISELYCLSGTLDSLAVTGIIRDGVSLKGEPTALLDDMLVEEDARIDYIEKKLSNGRAQYTSQISPKGTYLSCYFLDIDNILVKIEMSSVEQLTQAQVEEFLKILESIRLIQLQ